MRKLKWWELFIILIFLCVTFSSCGIIENMYEGLNYESLTNEKGDIYVFSGGKVVRTYENSKVIYSSSDTEAMLIKCNGKEHYLQGTIVIDLE